MEREWWRTVETGLLTFYSDVKSTPVNWLWYPYIAIGKITLLQGDPGDGKSTMMMNLISELSRGGATPDGKALGRPQRIIYQCSEDGVCDTIKPRLEACGADCRNIAFINEEIYGGLTLDDERIRDAIGLAQPVGINVETFGTGIMSSEELAEYVKASYDLTPRGIIEKLRLLDVDYNQTSAYGHFGKPGLPWEE